MTWDEKAVKRYIAWFDSEPGRFAFQMERRLLSRLMADWPRRGQRLLEVGCGPGIFLQSFYEDGFDITGLDNSPAMLSAARDRLGNRASLHLGHCDHLPFDDRDFDFSVMLTVLEFLDDPLPTLQELRRVSRKGVVIAFLNKWSLYYLSHGSRFRGAGGTLRTAHWRTAPAVRTLILQSMGQRPMQLRSVLPGPPFTWRDTFPWRYVNGVLLPSALGSYCAFLVDLVAEKPLTPLYAKTREPSALCR